MADDWLVGMNDRLLVAFAALLVVAGRMVMRQWQGGTNESLFWALLGGGGALVVFTMPALIAIFGLLVPFGVFGGAAGSSRQWPVR